jgi:hypothetical protein
VNLDVAFQRKGQVAAIGWVIGLVLNEFSFGRKWQTLQDLEGSYIRQILLAKFFLVKPVCGNNGLQHLAQPLNLMLLDDLSSVGESHRIFKQLR